MMRNILIVSAVLLGASLAAAQDDQSSSLADHSPADNVKGGVVQQRAPGRIVEAARARHSLLAQQRLAAQRAGDTSVLAPEETAALTGGAGNPLSSLLDGLLGSVGGVGGIGDLLGGLTGTSGATQGSTTDAVTGGTTGGANIPSNIPPEAIQMIIDAGIDINGLFGKTLDEPAAGLAADKSEQRSQTADTGETKFVTRWADAMLSSLFTALVIGFQTPDFVNLLADFIRPIFIPPNPLPAADAGDGTGRVREEPVDGADAADGVAADPNSIVWLRPARVASLA
ncbi:MAG: hypothetical protein D6744_01215 [Planctomycetota bacterium]|nr:MAG: hypothetical protein D6744_01215 [Planctomycetota bacterium]